MARNTAHGKKVPIYKTWWFWVIIILFIYGFVSGVKNSDDEEESSEDAEYEESTYNDGISSGCDAFMEEICLQAEEMWARGN